MTHYLLYKATEYDCPYNPYSIVIYDPPIFSIRYVFDSNNDERYIIDLEESYIEYKIGQEIYHTYDQWYIKAQDSIRDSESTEVLLTSTNQYNLTFKSLLGYYVPD